MEGLLMNLWIVNFSDIHFQTNSTSNWVMAKKDAIIRALKPRIEDNDKVLFVISGDVSFSGRKEEYQQAEVFLLDIIHSFENSNIIFVAGNHDCDFSGNQIARNALLDNLDRSAEISCDAIDSALFPQNNFQEFCKRFPSPQDSVDVVFSNNILRVIDFHFSESEHIRINLINTAWDSRIQEKAGTMLVPNIYVDEFCHDDTAAINLTILHHPYNWMNPENKRKLQEKLERTSDWIITGHEHIDGESTRNTKESSTIYSEADVLQDNSDADNCGFNLFKYNSLEKGSLESYNFHWDAKGSFFNVQTDYLLWNSTSNSFGSNESNKITVKENFLSFITSPGAPISKSGNEITKLNDLYVFPEIKDNLLKSKNNKRIDSKLLFNSIKSQENSVWFIEGVRESGKTALLRKLFLIALEKHMQPVFVKAQNIPSDMKKVTTSIEREFNGEYEDYSFERFQQSESKKILFLDDWDKLFLDSKRKKLLIKTLLRLFTWVIIAGDQLPQNQNDILGIQEETESSELFHYLTIQKFGNKKREELVIKWLNFNRDPNLSDDDIVIEIDKVNQQVNSILGKSYVPEVPLYILIILQSISNDSNISQLEHQSSQFFYQVLIQNAILRVGFTQQLCQHLYNYLTILAGRLFVDRDDDFDYGFLNNFHNWYVAEYALDPENNSLDKYKNALTKSFLLTKKENGMYSFSYPYIYYYFVGLFLSKNITHPETQQKILELINAADVGNNGDVLIFLVHHSHDDFILNSVVDVADKTLSDLKELRLEDDINEFNNLIDLLPKPTMITGRSAIENRLQVQSLNDQLDDQLSNVEMNESSLTLRDGAGEIAILNRSYKLTEIIGQILKDYSGEITGEQKQRLLSSAYRLSLRAGSKLIRIVIKERDDLINFIARLIKENNGNKTISPSDTIAFAKKIFFDFSTMLCAAIVQKAVFDTGTPALKMSYKSVSETPNLSTAKKLIIAMTYIESLYQHPQYGYPAKLYQKLQSNKMAQRILKETVLRFVYLFPLSTPEQQQIAAKYGFSYKVTQLAKIQKRGEFNRIKA